MGAALRKAMAMAESLLLSIAPFARIAPPSSSSSSSSSSSLSSPTDHSQAFSSSLDRDLPKFVEAIVEVPLGSLVKRRPDGSIDFVTPLPCPFNYGSVPAIIADDGDPLDAVLLGKHLPYQSTGVWKVKGVVKFMDAGDVDNKLICVPCKPTERLSGSFQSSTPELNTVRRRIRDTYYEDFSSNPKQDVTTLEVISLASFFSVYARFKKVLNMVRGKRGRTAYDGIELFS